MMMNVKLTPQLHHQLHRVMGGQKMSLQPIAYHFCLLQVTVRPQALFTLHKSQCFFKILFALFSGTIDPGFIPRSEDENVDDDDSSDIVDFGNLTDCDEDDDQPWKKCPFILSEASEVEDGDDDEEEDEP